MTTASLIDEIINLSSVSLLTRFISTNNSPEVKVNIGKHTLTALCDSGSSRTLLTSSLYQHIFPDSSLEKLHKTNLQIFAANGCQLHIFGIILIEININKNTFSFPFVIFEKNTHDILIGYDFLFENNLVIVPKLGLIRMIHKDDIQKTHHTYSVMSQSVTQYKCFSLENIQIQPGTVHPCKIKIGTDLPPSLQQSLHHALLIVHSEFLQPEITNITQIYIFYNVVIVAPVQCSATILVHNTSPVMLHIHKDDLIGHAEHPLDLG